MLRFGMYRKSMATLVGAALIGFAVLGGASVGLAQQAITLTPTPGVQTTTTLKVPMNKSQVVRANQAIGKIAIGNPAIADAVVLTDRSFYLLGKRAGATNVSVYGRDGQLLAVIDVSVGADVEGLKAALHEMLPNETIEVRSVNDSIVLGGQVSSPARASAAVEIAKQFVSKDTNAGGANAGAPGGGMATEGAAPGGGSGGGTVINQMSVRGVQQVMLQVKVAEMSRKATKALGFLPFARFGKANNPSGVTVQPLDPVTTTDFALAVASAISGNFALAFQIEALEEKDSIKILAEPNLVAMSGDTANFLAGGEFPVPVAYQPATATGTPTITIEFKPFGVSLAFTPTVIDNGLINLVVAPEVSEIDKTTSVVTSGFTIPGIAVRRARTTVELRDGQSFAIAGLIQSNFNDSVRQIPGLGDIPILGALARSSEFDRQETELVIMVTPKLVHPAPAGTLIAPTDSFVPPSDTDIFLFGQSEAGDSGTIPVNGGGLTGRYGHIIR
ncbi:MAG TPA: type II and III secretion system protein family protein [Aliidongia sp.]|nr:type II and III secretion system protein family protein [Aliidongia sp.]